MKEQKKGNRFVKLFTIFLIVVFLIGTFATGFIVMFGTNQQQVQQSK